MKPRGNQFRIAAALLLATFCVPAASAVEARPRQPAQPSSGPGGRDYPHAGVKSSRHGRGAEEYWLYEPADPAPASAPLVAFLHGWGGINPQGMGRWIEHLVRRGNIVVFPRYQMGAISDPKKCTPNALKAVGDAVAELKRGAHVRPDLEKFALVGHSNGGYVAANLAALAAAKGLPKPRALMCVQPGKNGFSPLEDLSRIPKGTLLLVVGADRDALVGDRDALPIYEGASAVPEADKNYLQLRSDDHGEPELLADHLAPCAADSDYDSGVGRLRGRILSRMTVDALDWHGYWKLFDGLCDAAFHGKNRAYALGNTPEQRSMDTWSDGTPVTEILVKRGAGASAAAAKTVGAAEVADPEPGPGPEPAPETAPKAAPPVDAGMPSPVRPAGGRSGPARNEALRPGVPVRLCDGVFPQWSPDGRRIAFTRLLAGREGRATRIEVFVMDADGGNQRSLTQGETALAGCGFRGQPFWHPGGNYIVFTAESRRYPRKGTGTTARPGIGRNHDIWIMTGDGGRFWKLTDYPENWGVIRPSFSHDGKKIFWNEQFSMEKYPDGLPGDRPKPHPGHYWGIQDFLHRKGEEFGAWRAVVAEFAFADGGPGISNVRKVNPPENFTLLEASGFSWDDRRIVYSYADLALAPGGRGTRGDIYTSDLNGGRLERLTRTPRIHKENAVYSPDGSLIAWNQSVAEDGMPGKCDIFVMRADGSGVRRLTRFNQSGAPEYDRNARQISEISWHPDGRRLVFGQASRKSPGGLDWGSSVWVLELDAGADTDAR
jgi:Tol biopolymer transport system component/acetyl esterase/lipase